MMSKTRLFISVLVMNLIISSSVEAVCNEDLVGQPEVIKEVILGESFDTFLYSGAQVIKNNRGSYNFIVYAEVPLNLNKLKAMHQRLVKSNIPPSDCRHRYHDNNDYSLNLNSGKLRGSSSIRYQKWACENIKEPYLHKGWIPRTRDRLVKTKIFTHVVHPTFEVLPAFLHRDSNNNLTHEFKISIKQIDSSNNLRIDESFSLGNFKIPVDYTIEQPVFLIRDQQALLRIHAKSADKLKTCTHYKKLQAQLQFEKESDFVKRVNVESKIASEFRRLSQ